MTTNANTRPSEYVPSEVPAGHEYIVVDGLGGPWLAEVTDEYPEPSPIGRIDDILADHTVAPACECPPCPGRGNDGHGMTHCAECCFGAGVEADIDCPVHGEATVAPTPPADMVPAAALADAWDEGHAASDCECGHSIVAHPKDNYRDCRAKDRCGCDGYEPATNPYRAASTTPTEGAAR